MLPSLPHSDCSLYSSGLFFFLGGGGGAHLALETVFHSNKEEPSRSVPLPDAAPRCYKSDRMTNGLFSLLFLFLCVTSFQQSFDPVNLMDPHHKHLPPEDVFITPRLDARPLRGSTATDKLDSYQQGQRGQRALRAKCFKAPPVALWFLVLGLDSCGLQIWH